MESPDECKLSTLPRLSLFRHVPCTGLSLEVVGLTQPFSTSRAGEHGEGDGGPGEVRQMRAADMKVVLFFFRLFGVRSRGDSCKCAGPSSGATEFREKALTFTAARELLLIPPNFLGTDVTAPHSVRPLLMLDPGADCNSVNFRLRTSCVAHHSALAHSTFGSFFSSG